MKKYYLILLLLVINKFSIAQQGMKDCIGSWKNDEIQFELKADGTTVLGGYPATFTFENNIMTFDFGSGVKLSYLVTIEGNKMTSEGYGETVEYERVTTSSVSQSKVSSTTKNLDLELVGKWCQVSTGTANISYSNCFVLNANGTYEYSTDGSISSEYGGVSHNGYDSGTWSYDGNILYAQSNSKGAVQYTCVKSHKNKDVALLVNGVLFVTYYLHNDWR